MGGPTKIHGGFFICFCRIAKLRFVVVDGFFCIAGIGLRSVKISFLDVVCGLPLPAFGLFQIVFSFTTVAFSLFLVVFGLALVAFSLVEVVAVLCGGLWDEQQE